MNRWIARGDIVHPALVRLCILRVGELAHEEPLGAGILLVGQYRRAVREVAGCEREPWRCVKIRRGRVVQRPTSVEGHVPESLHLQPSRRLRYHPLPRMFRVCVVPRAFCIERASGHF